MERTWGNHRADTIPTWSEHGEITGQIRYQHKANMGKSQVRYDTNMERTWGNHRSDTIRTWGNHRADTIQTWGEHRSDKRQAEGEYGGEETSEAELAG